MTIDDRARAAARALHDDVAAGLDTEAALVQVLAARAADRRRRLVPAIAAAVAVVALVAGALAVTGGDDDGPGDDDIAVDMDPNSIEGTPLQLLGPSDGMDSVRLPVALDPATSLVEGDTVHVTASGFEPGESVGIVQCTNDAGDPTFAGVDACMISPYTSATADADGNIVGDYEVRRLLTVPFSGTVDSAAAPGRCMIAVGAISNYDRSGATPIEFLPAEGSIDIPILAVSPAEGLSDGQVVHVTGSGFTGSTVGLQLCSASPSVCWSTGDPAAVEEVAATYGEGGNDMAYQYSPSLVVRSDGTVEGDVPVWRFLPGSTTGTYIDSAVSACTLRVSSDRAPAPYPLHFAGSEPAPVAPVVEVSPSTGLAAGSGVVVTGSGFVDGYVSVSLCAYQPATEASPAPGVGGNPSMFCTSVGDGSGTEVADDGTFVLSGALGSFDDFVECEGCEQTSIGPNWTYAIETYSYSESDMDLGSDDGSSPTAYQFFTAPQFQPVPVVVGYQP